MKHIIPIILIAMLLLGGCRSTDGADADAWSLDITVIYWGDPPENMPPDAHFSFPVTPGEKIEIPHDFWHEMSFTVKSVSDTGITIKTGQAMGVTADGAASRKGKTGFDIAAGEPLTLSSMSMSEGVTYVFTLVPRPMPAIAEFSLAYGSYHGGYYDFTIAEQDGIYYFTAEGSNGVTMYTQNQPIDEEDMERLAAVLTEGGFASWNNFSRRDDDVMDGFSFRLAINYEDGTTLQAGGYEEYPEGYAEAFPALQAFMMDLAHQYRTAPEWGAITSFMYYYAPGKDSWARYDIRGTQDGVVYEGTPGSKGALPDGTLEDLQRTLETLGIDRWYGFNGGGSGENGSFSLYIEYDNYTTLTAEGRGAFPEGFEEANRALLDYLYELSMQVDIE